jgi:hypothetical protein
MALVRRRYNHVTNPLLLESVFFLQPETSRVSLDVSLDYLNQGSYLDELGYLEVLRLEVSRNPC